MSADLSPGCLLIAAPAMLDPNFEGTVVLLCAHEKEGSVGLVLNRPMQIPAAQALPPAEFLGSDKHELRWGGPVGVSQVFLLHESPVSPAEGRQIAGGVHFGGGLDAAQRIEQSGGHLRFFVGYTGWGENQLEQEIEAGGWLLLFADAAEIWATDHLWQWERLVGKAAPELSWLRQAEHPDSN